LDAADGDLVRKVAAVATPFAAGLTGVNGRIDWHYYTAAGIHGYTATPIARRRNSEWKLTANVVLHDAFKMAQRPLVFVAKHSKGEWRFPILTYDLRDHKLNARLGPPQKEQKA
jgi:hypothetical protein